MKFNIETQIDWLEDDNIDEVIKKAIIAETKKTVVEKVLNDIIKTVNSGIIETINKKVDETYQKILANPIIVTDKWGDEKESFESLDQAVKKRFDKYMTEMVGNNGKPTTYGARTTRLEWLIDQRLEKLTQDFTKKAVDDIEAKIKETINQKLKDYVGEKLVDLVQLNKFIESQKNLNNGGNKKTNGSSKSNC